MRIIIGIAMLGLAGIYGISMARQDDATAVVPTPTPTWTLTGCGEEWLVDGEWIERPCDEPR